MKLFVFITIFILMSVYALAQIPIPPPPPDDISSANISCTNNIKDGDETDIDCGGSCGMCNTSMTCKTDEDCFNGHCSTENICIKDDSCSNRLRDGDETDTDCGGTCNPCINGLNCISDTDCISDFCNPEKVCSNELEDTMIQNSSTNTINTDRPNNKSCPECICDNIDESVCESTSEKKNNIFFWLIFLYGIGCSGVIVYLLKDKLPTLSNKQELVIEHQLTPREESAQNYVSQYTTLGYSRNSIEVGLRRNNFSQEEINKAFESQTI